MSSTIISQYPITGAIATSFKYLDARKKIRSLAQKYNLQIADMPTAINAIYSNQEIKDAIHNKSLYTLSCEYQGLRGGKKHYEVWHNLGTINTINGLENGLSYNQTNFGFIKINKREWDEMQDGHFQGKEFPRFHIDDIKNDNPSIEGPYSIFFRPDRDKVQARNGMAFYTDFMKDDRAIMLAGSEENREKLAEYFFKNNCDKPDCKTISLYNRINLTDYQQPSGRHIVLLDSGIRGSNDQIVGSCFLGINKNTLDSKPSGIDEILSVIDNPELARDDIKEQMKSLIVNYLKK
ncbi:MAG: hypothetical protein ACQESF_03960 [Nanobdellota archaeon]